MIGIVRKKTTPTQVQVEEQKTDTEYAEGTIGWAMAVRKMNRNADIEHCAQVAEDLANQYGGTPARAFRLAAAAIRKLKDEP